MSRTFTEMISTPQPDASFSMSTLISSSSWSRRNATSPTVERPTASRSDVCARYDMAA